MARSGRKAGLSCWPSSAWLRAIRGTQTGPVDPSLVRFIAIYTLAMMVVYSALPYKTPWCLLSFLTGLILLAGVGVVALWTWARSPSCAGSWPCWLVAAVAHLAFLAYRANFVYYADSRNPYVYAHPTEEILTAVDTVKEYAATTGVGRSEDRPILVAVPGMDYWPLPWYFRDLPVRGVRVRDPERGRAAGPGLGRSWKVPCSTRSTRKRRASSGGCTCTCSTPRATSGPGRA